MEIFYRPLYRKGDKEPGLSTPEYVAAILVMAKSLMAQRCLNEFAENID